MVTLTAEPAVEGAAFYADERLAKQMLVNLLSNGVKYTPSGGAVQFGTALAPDGSAVVSVQDTGVGMTEADLAKALEPIGTLDRTQTRRVGKECVRQGECAGYRYKDNK